MDFLIGGLGLGAILAIAGFALRELTAGRPTEPGDWIRPASLAMMLSAAIIWSITLAALLAELDDSTALWVVVGGSLFAIAGSTAAGWAMRSGEVVPQVLPANPSGGDLSPDRVHPMETTPIETDEPLTIADVSRPAGESEVARDPGAVSATRESRDWEEIWRQTWGSTGQAATNASLPSSDPATGIEPDGVDAISDYGSADQAVNRELSLASQSDQAPSSTTDEDAGRPEQPLEEVVSDRAAEWNLEDETPEHLRENRTAVSVPNVHSSERDRTLVPPDEAK